MRVCVRLILLCGVLFQAACTSVVWNGGVYDADRAIETHISHTSDHDQIHAFGRTSTGHLMMMGEKHWYAVRDDVSHDFQQVLQATLPANYQITEPYSGTILPQMPVTVHQNRRFSSQFCLDYLIRDRNPKQQQETETHRLKQMQFQQQLNPNLYRKCFAIVGHLQHPPDKWQYDARFHTDIAVKLQIEQQHTKIQSNKLARNILLTPFAFVADVAGGMVMLPALILGDLF